MRFLQLLPLVMTTIVSHSASADQCEAAQGLQTISFQAIAGIVSLEDGAVILDRPGGKPLFLLRRAGTASAMGVSTDRCWWEIVLPNGDAAYVSAATVVHAPDLDPEPTPED